MSPPLKGVMKSVVPAWMLIALWKYQENAAATLKRAENLVPICVFLTSALAYWLLDEKIRLCNEAESKFLNNTAIASAAVSVLSLLSMFLSIMLPWPEFFVPLWLQLFVPVVYTCPLFHCIYTSLLSIATSIYGHISTKIGIVVNKIRIHTGFKPCDAIDGEAQPL